MTHITAIATIALGLACAIPSVAQSRIGPLRPISPPDCVTPDNILVEDHTAPLDETYMRVRHMGDPGTLELEAQAANVISWNVGTMTGLRSPHEAQRGFRDEPPPTATSAFQLWCNGAGVYINTFQFSHNAPIVGGGPNVSVARDFATPLPAWNHGASLMMEATVRVPSMRNQRETIFREGTAQVALWFYARDTKSGAVVAQLVHLFDNRAPGVNGSGVEYLGTDYIVMFISSPLAPTDGLGNPVRFVTADSSSATMQYQAPWEEARRFRAIVTPANFGAALAELKANSMPHVSQYPSDYVVLSFGVLVEVIPGTGDGDNVAIGASIEDLAMSQLPLVYLEPSF